MLALSDVLLLISNGLLVPVVVALLVFSAGTFVNVGGVIGEAFARRRTVSAVRAFVEDLVRTPDRPVDAAALPDPPRSVRAVIECVRRDARGAAKALDDAQIAIERRLLHLELGVRLGPMLGLAGTLIPIGPALVALSQGDIETLSRKLVVAFTTTVVGLMVGGACYVLRAIRRGWYVQDLNDAEYLAARVVGPGASGGLS